MLNTPGFDFHKPTINYAGRFYLFVLSSLLPMHMDSERTRWDSYCSRLESDFRNDKNAPSHWTVPFIPWCGERYWSAHPRILFVGKTVGAFNDPDGELWKVRLLSDRAPTSFRKATDDYITQKVAAYRPNSPNFWIVPFLVAGALLPSETEYSQIAHSIAWSNLWKVNSGRTGGMPGIGELKCSCGIKHDSEHQYKPEVPSICLAHHSAACLREELEILRPDVVLIGVHKRWWTFTECLSSVLHFNKNSQNVGEPPFPIQLSPEQAFELSPRFQPKSVWITNHFSAWGQNASHGKLILEIRKALRDT